LPVRWPALLLLPAAAALTLLGVPAARVPSRPLQPPIRVVVRGSAGALPVIEHAVRRLGGRVGRRLAVIDGLEASVPAASVRLLANLCGGCAVTPDGPVHLAGAGPGAAGAVGTAVLPVYQAAEVADVQRAWKAGYTGKGIDIALIDSGVVPVQGLTSGNVVNGPDLSFESQDPSRIHMDTFGHGTHMAGIIAGRDQAGTPASYLNPSVFDGVAPDARLISIKVAAADGATDVSQVIAAIDWVIEHAHDPGFNIRVVNLSFGTDSTQDYRLDPLAYAAEVAWRKGIVVVVAGGNDGRTTTLLSDPAMDPYPMAVGAEDPQGTLTVKDDTVPAFATRGTPARHVDLVAPAVHIASLRDPQSFIDQAFPSGRNGTRFFLGSGTSQSTALVSGAAALLLQRRPALVPDQVKRVFMATAVPFQSASNIYRGAGAIDVAAALAGDPGTAGPALGPGFGTGTGSLESARGTAHVSDQGVDLTGEQDIFGKQWIGSDWAAAALDGRTWTGGEWNGSIWTGSDWSGTSWTGATWSSRTWTGADWAGVTWDSRTWTTRTWTDSGWDTRTWTDSCWRSRTWTDSTWAYASWH
jgi:serine protease AprX